MKEIRITADFCNKKDNITPEEIFNILLNSFSHDGNKEQHRETWIRNQFLACLTTSRISNWPSAAEPYTKHTIHVDTNKGKEQYAECIDKFEKAGFKVEMFRNGDTDERKIEVSWDKPSETKEEDCYTFSAEPDSKKINKNSDRYKMLEFIEKIEQQLKKTNPGEKIEIDSENDFPDNLYKSLETLMFYLLTNGYKEVHINYNYPPKIAVQNIEERPTRQAVQK